MKMDKQRLSNLVQTAVDAAMSLQETLSEIEMSGQPIRRGASATINRKAKESLMLLETIPID